MCRENKYYNINTLYNFKAPTDADIKTGDVIEAVTYANDGLCGGHLPLNKDFLIAGIQSNNLMEKKKACIFFLIQLSLFARFEEVHWKEKFKDTKDVTHYYILPMIVSRG